MDAPAVSLRQRSRGPGRFRFGFTSMAVVLAATCLAAGIGLVPTVAPNPAAAAESAAAGASMKEIREALDLAASLLAEGKASKAADRVAQAAAQIGQVANQERLPSGLRPLWDRCRALRDDIALEGIDIDRIRLEPLRGSVAKVTGNDRGRTAAASMPPAGKPAGAARSAAGFSDAVAPILARHCGGCHIAGRKGGFQMTSYAGLMKTGMVQPGAGEASRLVEVILSGDMPRGGGKVSPDEVGVLMRWIDAGAPFDGPDPGLPIDAIARQSAAATTAVAPAMASPSPPAAVKLKAGEVSFASAVAPVLLEHCAGCHDANNPESNLSMATFERLLRGGRGGAPLVAGKSAESLLIKKIKGAGIEGQRMPLGKDPLPDSVIATIQAWVDQGIKLDMLTPKDDLSVVAAAGRASTLSHADLRPVRFEAGRKLWTRAIPDERPVVEEHGDVLMVGNLSGGRMEALVAQVAKAEERLRQDLTGGDVVIKGGLVVYAFAKPYDFSSFWQAVLSDERPKAVTSSAGVTGDVVYAALVPGADDTAAAAETAAVVTEQMAAAALLGRGVPAWFARGAGRVMAIKAAPKSAAVGAWRRHLPEAMQRMGSAADVMAGHGDPESLAAVSAGFVTTIATGNRLAAVVGQMDQGATFAQAFQTVFRSSPQAAFEAWCGQQSRGSKR